MKNPSTFVRYDRDGIDDVLVTADQVHFERLSDNSFWLGITRGTQRIIFTFESDEFIECFLSEDELGAVDDTKMDIH